MSELTNVFTGIADAIRSKTGSSATMTPAQMATAIGGISTGIEKIELSQSAYDNLPLVDKEDPTKLYIIYEHDYLYKWNFTKTVNPLIDEIQNTIITLNANTAIDNEGIHFDNTNDGFYMPFKINKNYIYEIDIPYAERANDNNAQNLLITASTGTNYFHFNPYAEWYFRGWTIGQRSNESGQAIALNENIFNGKTLKLLYIENIAHIYADDVLVYKAPEADYLVRNWNRIYVGSNGSSAFYNMTVSGIRIYENI